uniref:Uncharacterized protein n=1 Tax=Pipistrellus kuhlii TaxID=59472 RepID=A0A7J7ZK07_PIPKU|nr:hypothetical protein mPipKuh1_009648 [Pipistrellus kuhlii]
MSFFVTNVFYIEIHFVFPNMYFSYFLPCLVCIQLYCLGLRNILTQRNCRVRKRGIRKYICNERNPSFTKQGGSSSQKQVETPWSKAVNWLKGKKTSELLGWGTQGPPSQSPLTRPRHVLFTLLLSGFFYPALASFCPIT